MITHYVNTKMIDKKRYGIAVVLYALTAVGILLLQSFYASVIISLTDEQSPLKGKQDQLR